MAGTFVATFTIFNITGNIAFGTTDYLIFTNGGGISESSNGHLAFILQGNCISLDGNPPIGLPSLPSGFTPTSATLRSVGINPMGGTGLGFTFRHSLASVAHLKTEFGIYSFDLLAQNISTQYPAGPYNLTNPIPTLFDLTTFLAFDLDFNTPSSTFGGETVAVWYNLEVSGTYDIVKTQFQIKNSSAPVRVGDKVEIDGTELDKIDKIQLDYNDATGPKTIIIDNTSNYIIYQTSFQLFFYLPIELGTFSGLLNITLIGNGTQFSGSVQLGILQVLYEDASGIYRLTEGQTNDILYFRDGYTTDEKFALLQNLMNEDDNINEDNEIFNLLPNSSRILFQNSDDFDDEDQLINLSIITTLRVPVSPFSVEIPSPFIRTGFLP
jgi:hypothetical protein